MINFVNRERFFAAWHVSERFLPGSLENVLREQLQSKFPGVAKCVIPEREKIIYSPTAQDVLQNLKGLPTAAALTLRMPLII
jgi:hypothetical protein